MEFKPTEQERFDYLNYGIAPAFPLAALCVKGCEGESKRIVFVPGEDEVGGLQWAGGDFRVLFTNGRTHAFKERDRVLRTINLMVPKNGRSCKKRR